MWPKSANKPSEISMQLVAMPRRAKPSAARGVGVCSAFKQISKSFLSTILFCMILFCKCAKPKAALPS